MNCKENELTIGERYGFSNYVDLFRWLCTSDIPKRWNDRPLLEEEAYWIIHNPEPINFDIKVWKFILEIMDRRFLYYCTFIEEPERKAWEEKYKELEKKFGDNNE